MSAKLLEELETMRKEINNTCLERRNIAEYLMFSTAVSMITKRGAGILQEEPLKSMKHSKSKN